MFAPAFQQESLMNVTTRKILIAAFASAALAGCQDKAANDTEETANVAQTEEKTVTVGGAPMYATKTIVENASKSADHTTLVSAVKAAGLAETLSGPGPYTVFAPTNAAFLKLPAGAVDGLLKPEAKADLTGLLTYHVVPGVVTAADLEKAIDAGDGKAELATVAGGKLTATKEDGGIVVTDGKGGKAKVSQADVIQSNGVIHVVDSVLMPQ